MVKNDSMSSAAGQGQGHRILIAYFSHSGNTRVVANKIHESAGGDLFEIVAVHQYPRDYTAVVQGARKELDADCRPELKVKVGDMGAYDVVFLGYPNWWGTVPRPVASFLSGYDFAGKTLVPFCTHEGSGLGRSVAEIRALCPQSTVLDGLAVRGRDVHNAQGEVSRWLRVIGLSNQA